MAGLALTGSLLAASPEARACGSTPYELEALLPLDGATNVPLNAVFITSSNMSLARFELREVSALRELEGEEPRASAESADAGANRARDAGAPATLLLDVDCGAGGADAGAVCIARPRELLKPNTRYSWTAAPVDAPGGSEVSRELTTGSATDDLPLPAASVSLVMNEYNRDVSYGCGAGDTMDVAYSLRASEDAVLQLTGYTPSYVMHATLLTHDAEATTTLYSPPDCLSPVLYDAAGHRTVLPEWCPRREAESDAGALCALTGSAGSSHGAGPMVLMLGSALLMLGGRRGRRR